MINTALLLWTFPDLTLPQGEIIGIIGNNGAGKSTFARCLCGLDKRALGELELNGHSYLCKAAVPHILHGYARCKPPTVYRDVLMNCFLVWTVRTKKKIQNGQNQILSSLDLAAKIKLQSHVFIWRGKATGSDWKVLSPQTRKSLFLTNRPVA